MNDAAAPARHQQRSRAWLIVLGVATVLTVIFFLVFDWDWLRKPIAQRVTNTLGRPFGIVGHLEVDLGSTIIIKATGLELANARWSKSPEMGRADLVRAEIPFWPLLRGERLLRRLDVVRPRLLLERNAAGAANWQFGGPKSNGPSVSPNWRFGALRIHQGELRVRDEPFDTDLHLRVDSVPVSDDEYTAASTRLLGQGSGRYKGHDFRLDGRADSPTVLFVHGDEKYDIEINARAGATRARVWGALAVPLNFEHFAVQSKLAGDDLEDVYHLLGLALPSTPPYEVSGILERNRRVVRLSKMTGRMGDSDVAGEVTIDMSGKKPLLRANIESKQLDFDDLGGLIGAAPGSKPGETVSDAQRKLASERAANPHLLPDKPYNLQKLASLDANLELRAQSVDAGKLPIDTLATHVLLQDSVMRLDPLDMGFAGGHVRGNVQLDARREKIDATAKLTVRKLDLERFWPNMQPPNVGLLSGDIELQGHGNSVADMLATANGHVGVAMGKGRFSNLLLELAGLDVAESLKFLVGKDKTVKLRCAYSEWNLTDGHAKAQSLVFDTTDTVLFGEGGFDFSNESLNLELKPQPKDFSPVTLRGPLEIKGTFKDPSFLPKPKPLLARAAVAAALYTLAPPAALLALIETGPGENVDCGPPQGTGHEQKGTGHEQKGKKPADAGAGVKTK